MSKDKTVKMGRIEEIVSYPNEEQSRGKAKVEEGESSKQKNSNYFSGDKNTNNPPAMERNKKKSGGQCCQDWNNNGDNFNRGSYYKNTTTHKPEESHGYRDTHEPEGFHSYTHRPEKFHMFTHEPEEYKRFTHEPEDWSSYTHKAEDWSEYYNNYYKAAAAAATAGDYVPEQEDFDGERCTDRHCRIHRSNRMYYDDPYGYGPNNMSWRQYPPAGGHYGPRFRPTNMFMDDMSPYDRFHHSRMPPPYMGRSYGYHHSRNCSIM